MENHLISYFKGEKAESLLFMILGMTILVIAIWIFFKGKDGFLNGLAYPLILIALVQVVVGGTVYFRTDAQATELVRELPPGNEERLKKEIVRMEGVILNFHTYKIIEAVFIVIGLLFLFVIKEKSLWMGVGLGMLIQGSIMITLDVFAEKRGEVYLRSLKMESIEAKQV